MARRSTVMRLGACICFGYRVCRVCTNIHGYAGTVGSGLASLVACGLQANAKSTTKQKGPKRPRVAGGGAVGAGSSSVPGKSRSTRKGQNLKEPSLGDVYAHFGAYADALQKIPMCFMPKHLCAASGLKSFSVVSECGSRLLIRLDTQSVWMAASCQGGEIPKPHTRSFKHLECAAPLFDEILGRICPCSHHVWNPKRYSVVPTEIPNFSASQWQELLARLQAGQ